MLRKFLSQHPTFGSYKQPIKSKVEASPYYWWWFALTLNGDYLRYCANNEKHTDKTHMLNTELAHLANVYRDFGDVRYSGDPHKAFARWWRGKVTTDETRGEYLFAEKNTPAQTRVAEVIDIRTAEKALSEEHILLVKISTTMPRSHIDRALDRLLKKRLNVRPGRGAGSHPKGASAKYKLTKPLLASALKKTFDLYVEKQARLMRSERITNKKLAQAVGIVFNEREGRDSVSDYASRSRIISIQVSRYLSSANRLIEQTSYGRFGD